MDVFFRWAVWGLSLVIPNLGLVWCLTTPTKQIRRDHEVVPNASEG